jgi:hypothetical protein
MCSTSLSDASSPLVEKSCGVNEEEVNVPLVNPSTKLYPLFLVIKIINTKNNKKYFNFIYNNLIYIFLKIIKFIK